MGDGTAFYGVFLLLSAIFTSRFHGDEVNTYVVFSRSISKFRGKDVEQSSVPPSLFAVDIVCEMIRSNSSKTTLLVVRARPWITGGDEGR